MNTVDCTQSSRQSGYVPYFQGAQEDSGPLPGAAKIRMLPGAEDEAMLRADQVHAYLETCMP